MFSRNMLLFRKTAYKPKCGALTERRAHLKLAAHHFNQLAANCQT